MIQSQQFRAVRRPKALSSPYALVVVDGKGIPHLPLTVFSHETQRFLAEGTAKTYLAALLPDFDYLAADSWRRERKDCWDSSPDAVRESVRDCLVEQLHCKAQPRETDQLIRLTEKSPSTVHVFLCALKQFYHLAQRKERYPYPHPLTDPTANLLQDSEAEERREAGQRPRMPQHSGVEEPRHRLLSDNYFKLVHGTWQPHPIDDPHLHRVLRQGFPRARIALRDQLVIRMAYESGARIREILRLTVGDWRKRGGKQEAWAFSKGSHGRRVKVIRWSAETSRMLLASAEVQPVEVSWEEARVKIEDAIDYYIYLNRKNARGDSWCALGLATESTSQLYILLAALRGLHAHTYRYTEQVLSPQERALLAQAWPMEPFPQEMRRASRALWNWTRLVWQEAERRLGRSLLIQVDEAALLAAMDRLYTP